MDSEKFNSDAQFLDITNSMFRTIESIQDTSDFYYLKALSLQVKELLISQGMDVQEAERFLIEQW